MSLSLPIERSTFSRENDCQKAAQRGRPCAAGSGQVLSAFRNVSVDNSIAYVSGMAGSDEGKIIKGVIGESISVRQAVFAARQISLMTLAASTTQSVLRESSVA